MAHPCRLGSGVQLMEQPTTLAIVYTVTIEDYMTGSHLYVFSCRDKAEAYAHAIMREACPKGYNEDRSGTMLLLYREDESMTALVDRREVDEVQP